MSKITEHLSEEEYRCGGVHGNCCGNLPPDYDPDNMPEIYDYLFGCFEDIREAWGKPLIVSSGYRCFKHNQAVGGEPLSAHLFGVALDLACKDKAEVKVLRDVVRKTCPYIRIGWKMYSDNLVHIDNAFSIMPRPTRNFAMGVEW